MLKRIVEVLAVVCLAAGTASAADNPFIGGWKLDPAKTRMPDEMKVESKGGNIYAFDFGGGAETIAVDGTYQPGGYGTLLSVKPYAPDTWIVERKMNDRLMLRATWTLAKDGTTLTDRFRQFITDDMTFSIDYVYQRNGGGSGFAADWRSVHETMNSPFPLQVSAFQGDGLSIATAIEKKTQDVTFDGKDHPYEGPAGAHGFTASAQRVDARNFVITDKAKGTVTDTEEVGLSPDLKTLTITTHTPGNDRPSVMVFERE